jgi:hypothetical protein
MSNKDFNAKYWINYCKQFDDDCYYVYSFKKDTLYGIKVFNVYKLERIGRFAGWTTFGASYYLEEEETTTAKLNFEEITVNSPLGKALSTKKDLGHFSIAVGNELCNYYLLKIPKKRVLD